MNANAPCRLVVTTPGEREIVLTREFNAPPALVYEAMTKPELIRRWLLGPPGVIMVVCEVDLRVGGVFRYVWRMPDGAEMGMGGRYLEFSPPDRTVHSEKFDDYPGESVVTTVLVEKDGRTTLTATIDYDSQATRDAVIASGMEHGVAASYDRLEELVMTA